MRNEFDAAIAVQATGLKADFEKRLMTSKTLDAAKETLLMVVTNLNEEPKLENFMMPHKLVETILRILLFRIERAVIGFIDFPDGVILLYRYLLLYVYSTGQLKFFQRAENVYDAERAFKNGESVNKPNSTIIYGKKYVKVFGDKLGRCVFNFINAKDFEDLKDAAIQLINKCDTDDRSTVCMFTQFHLSMLCLYQLYHLPSSRAPFSDVLAAKCKILEKLFSVHTYEDCDEFFDELLDLLY